MSVYYELEFFSVLYNVKISHNFIYMREKLSRQLWLRPMAISLNTWILIWIQYLLSDLVPLYWVESNFICYLVQASSFGSGVCNLVIRRHVNVLDSMFGMNWIADRHLVSMSKDQNTWKLLEVASDECGLSRLHCVSKHTGKQNND